MHPPRVGIGGQPWGARLCLLDAVCCCWVGFSRAAAFTPEKSRARCLLYSRATEETARLKEEGACYCKARVFCNAARFLID